MLGQQAEDAANGGADGTSVSDQKDQGLRERVLQVGGASSGASALGAAPVSTWFSDCFICVIIFPSVIWHDWERDTPVLPCCSLMSTSLLRAMCLMRPR